jgi:hypothetical protein
MKVRKWAKGHQRWKRGSGPKVRLNPRDKSTGIVTIEGTSMMFDLWYRKMEDVIPQWNAAKLDRAIELLDGPARVHAQLVELRKRLDR